MRVTLSHLVIGGTSVGALVGFYVQQLAIENWRVSLYQVVILIFNFHVIFLNLCSVLVISFH